MHDVYRGRECMKKFCECLREHSMNTIHFRKKKNGVTKKQTARTI